jgi:hypothetical protein
MLFMPPANASATAEIGRFFDFSAPSRYHGSEHLITQRQLPVIA